MANVWAPRSGRTIARLDPGARGDIVREMLEAGELTAMLDEKGVAYDKTKLTA